jgi:Flp pilus assembly protein TadG
MLRRLIRDRRGVSILEFALVAPILLLGVIGVAQVGILFFANAGLKNSVGEAARYATTYPKPSDAQITAKLSDKRFGINALYLGTPTITSGTVDGATYVQITQSYNVPLDFVLIKPNPVTITVTRRAFTYSNL